ncbi:MAG: phospho-sugar mutase [Clostridiales bacterium]|jgi:phosphoglucomutase|nr:phospho-sugar mutase [Clostridiales bacterium]
MNINPKSEYMRWLNSPALDSKTKAELLNLTESEINERFCHHLEFGTAGLRGKMEAGINRLNVYTIRKATSGLANYIAQHSPESKSRGVVISYDSRNNSRDFAFEAAKVLASNDIKVYIYDSLRPTPQLSFSVRHLHAIAGIMVTASHNPKEYNGYKVYWEDGGQLPPLVCDKILPEIDAADEFNITFDEARISKNIQVLDEKIDDAYINIVLQQKINKGGNVSIVYSPLHGAGFVPVTRALAEAGFDNVTLVESQCQPDGNFPTCSYPNPEFIEALELSINKAKQVNADIIIATDPDSDRTGVCARRDDGEYEHFTGNQVGIMLTEYILTQRYNKQNTINNAKTPVVISTIVSSRLTQKICEDNNAEYFDVYTGFKFIGEKILTLKPNEEFAIGWEESIGYLIGDYARDKDAVVASIMVAEMAQFCKDNGSNLLDYLDGIYKKYGYYCEKTIHVTHEGLEGTKIISEIMAGYRAKPPKAIGGKKVVAMRDYSTLKRSDYLKNEMADINMNQTSNVIAFELEENCSITVRPSGTEPKIKYYISAVNSDKTLANASLIEIEKSLK